MELLLIIIGIAFVWWLISNNKTSVKDETVITTTRTVKIDGGEQTVTRTTVIDNNQMDIRNPNTPITQPVHKILEPTPRELELERELELIKQQNRVAIEAKKIVQLSHMQSQSHISNSNSLAALELKECPNCKRTQPKSAFRANHNQPDGLTKWCISCLDNQEKLLNPASLQGMKVCPKCHQTRRKSSFYLSKKYPDGLSKWCKFCLK